MYPAKSFFTGNIANSMSSNRPLNSELSSNIHLLAILRELDVLPFF